METIMESEITKTIVHIYIIHYDILKDRVNNINTFLEIIKCIESPFIFKVHIIKEFNPDKLPKLDKIISLNKIENPTKNDEIFNSLLKDISINNISNALKHYKSLELISNCENDNDIHIVLEDDIMFSENQMKMFFSNLIEMNNENNYDILFLGLPHTSVVNKHKISIESTLNNEGFHMFPCCESYVVKKSGAKKIYDNFLPIRFETNIQLSYVLTCNPLINSNKMFPNIFADGSKIGTFTSSINPNNVLLHNMKYKMLFNILKQQTMNSDDHSKINQILSNSDVKDIVDFKYLHALYKMQLKLYDEALKIFEEVYVNYKKLHVPMNNKSVFLKNYISLYKQLQI